MKQQPDKVPVKECARANRLDVSSERDGKVNMVLGKVGEHEVEFVLDSGAALTVVPDELVCPKQMTGEFIHVWMPMVARSADP